MGKGQGSHDLSLKPPFFLLWHWIGSFIGLQRTKACSSTGVFGESLLCMRQWRMGEGGSSDKKRVVKAVRVFQGVSVWRRRMLAWRFACKRVGTIGCPRIWAWTKPLKGRWRMLAW
eukprot:1160770-Pelagomonas_calceolata.AAC.2